MLVFAFLIAVSIFTASVRGAYYIETVIDESSSGNPVSGAIYFTSAASANILVTNLPTATPTGSPTVITPTDAPTSPPS
eukprot:gene13636-15023_t